MTGLIVIKILKVFLEIKRTLGSFCLAIGRPNYQHIALIIIESGMALFAIHLARIVISILMEAPEPVILPAILSPSLALSIANDSTRINFAFTLIFFPPNA